MMLYDYQQEMLDRVEKALDFHRSVMVQMPTGTGKTLVMASLVGRAANEGGNAAGCRVLVVAHRMELITQIADMLGRFGISCGIIAQGRALRGDENVAVASIQTLARRTAGDCGMKPDLVIVDEAHHALAATYRMLWEWWGDARFVGFTATPCRLSGDGFTDLFDVLLTSWDMEHFMAEGRLCYYDYYSIAPDSMEQKTIDSLAIRGADGDYQTAEMSRVLNRRPTIERLYRSVERYAKGRKGIVYAIDIDHARAIADYYVRMGKTAVAVDCNTPEEMRRKMTDDFRLGQIDILVNVDIFSEGFDCPDVEFVQLARPTLSLSRYMQMVGRGLRTAADKDFCVIMDNVGAYRLFGLPSCSRDWQELFLGTEKGLRLNGYDNVEGLPSCRSLPTSDEALVEIVNHESQRKETEYLAGFVTITDDGGRKGVADKDGNVVVPCRFLNVVLYGNGMALCYNKRHGRHPWIDLKTGRSYAARMRSVWHRGIEFLTTDGISLVPRIKSVLLEGDISLVKKVLELQVGAGLTWKKWYVPYCMPGKVLVQERRGKSGVRVYHDEEGVIWVQRTPMDDVFPLSCPDSLDVFMSVCGKESLRWREKWRSLTFKAERTVGRRYNGYEESGDGIVCEHDAAGRMSWVDTRTGYRHLSRPVLLRRGYVELLREDDALFVRNIKELAGVALREWDVVADDNVCVVENSRLYFRTDADGSYLLLHRSDDLRYFLVETFTGMSVPEGWEMRIKGFPSLGKLSGEMIRR
ncbi:MAG: DEAD/DEAH box helicase [Prevotella sp.]